jgi:acetylornithine deacetylase
VPGDPSALYPVKTMSSNPAAALDPIALTRRLIDIESTTFHEGAVGRELVEILTGRGFCVETMPVEQVPEISGGGERFNVYAGTAGENPDVVLSTHMDTVPPYFASSEDDEFIYGRGACDAKGIIAAQIAAAERLRSEGVRVGLLFVAGEERDSAGAKVANRYPRGSRFLINGEPTDNRLALASKGTLRVKLTAKGKLAHSAYPELGESAIHKLLEALKNVMALPLPVTEDIGASTLNVGLIEGGRAPNVVADHAEAQLLIRLVGPAEETRAAVVKAVGDLAEVEFTLEIPFQRFRAIDGLPTMIAAFTTDIPWLATWGEPLLLGPGSIHVAHTHDERLAKRELLEAVELYVKVAKGLVGA